MLFSVEQFVILAVVLIAGFLLGFASRPSTRKWKRRVAEQSRSFSAYHADAEDRVRAARERATALEAEAAALRADREEAERTIVALKSAQPAAASDSVERPAPAPVETPEPVQDDVPVTVSPSPEPADRPVAQSAARPAFAKVEDPAPEASAPLAMTPTPSAGEPAPIGPAEPRMPRRGWFAGPPRDDLTRIRGIDSGIDARLSELGVVSFEDLAKLSDEDEMALEQRLALPAGTLTRDAWRTQAALLSGGHDEEHTRRYGDQAPG